MRRFGPATAFGVTLGSNAVIVTVSVLAPAVSETRSEITNAPSASGVKLGCEVLPIGAPFSALPFGALVTVHAYASVSPICDGSLLAVPFSNTGDPRRAFADAPAFALG